MSGWWFASSASAATWFTNSIASGNDGSSNGPLERAVRFNPIGHEPHTTMYYATHRRGTRCRPCDT